MNHMDIQGRILQSLRPRRDGVLLRSDVNRFGSSTQVSTALRTLQDRGLLQRLSQGVYAKPNEVAQQGEQVLRERALERMKQLRKIKATARRRITPTARHVQLLARRSGISFVQTYTDRWANAVTQMAGDQVRSDATDDLLVALLRAGKVSPREMASLVIAHHRELKRV